MPIRNGESGDDRSGEATTILASPAAANVQLELPALLAVALFTPQFERADFSDATLEDDRHEIVVALPARIERDLQRGEGFEILAPVFNQRARRVVLANRR